MGDSVCETACLCRVATKAGNWPPRWRPGPPLFAARFGAVVGPEFGDPDVRLPEQIAKGRDGEPDDGMRVAVDLADEGPAQAVDREGTGAVQGLAGCDVG